MKNADVFNEFVAVVFARLLDEFPNEIRMWDLNTSYPESDEATIQLYCSTIRTRRDLETVRGRATALGTPRPRSAWCRAPAALAGALWVTLAPALGGCYRHAWRPAVDAPLASAAAGDGTLLRVTTRALATGVTRRYVLVSARVERDSVVGLVYEEYQRRGAGRWRAVPQHRPRRRVAVAAADVVEAVRGERELSPARTVTYVVLALAAATGIGILLWGLSQP